MTEERVVPVKTWLRPSTYRVLHRQAQRRGLENVGELLERFAEHLVHPPTGPVPAAKPKRRGTPKYTPEELAQRRDERRRAFYADEEDPRHGTHNGYTNLGCRCDPCRQGSADYNAGRR